MPPAFPTTTSVSNDYDQDLMRELMRDLRPQLEGIVSTKELDFAAPTWA
jgi:hypothetical protein